MKSNENYSKIFVKQHGDFACGLACLAMIIKYYGGNARQEDLRNISGTTLQGTSLLGLYQAAGKLNFSAAGYTATIDSLKTVAIPVILHVVKNRNLEHYMVCFGYEDGKFIIGDPGWGILKMSESELDAIWNSKALLKLEPTEKFQKVISEKKDKYVWLKNIIKDDYPILAVALFLGIIVSLLGLVMAVFSQRLIDELLPSKNYEKIMMGIMLVFVLLIFRNGLDYIRNIFMARQSRDFNSRLISGFFSKILYLPKFFFDSTKTGEITARMNDSRRIQQTLTYVAGEVLINILILVFSIGYLFIYSWKPALIASGCIPAFALLVFAYNKKIAGSQRKVMETYALTEGLFIDSVQGINEIKAANKQNFFKRLVNNIYGYFQDSSYKLGLLGAKYGLITQIISTITMIGLIVLGVTWVLNGQLKLGELMAIITVGGMIISSTANLSVVNIRLQEAGVAFDRFYEFLKAKPEFEPEKEVQAEKMTGEWDKGNICLQIKDLSFRFIGRKKLFDNISLEVKKGEMITLFGEVGSGKSTLIQILQKHYLPESGEILLNGKPFSEYSIPVWREHIGVVNQHVKIFNGTVGENICMGDFENEKDSIVDFCKDYQFDSFFNNLPQGLYTLLGEDGVNISGGQQQLISLARALYRRPSLLLLDEPTSAMDSKTEQFVMNILKQKNQELAIILVTHRVHLAKYSDRIYVLENGTTAMSTFPH